MMDDPSACLTSATRRPTIPAKRAGQHHIVAGTSRVRQSFKSLTGYQGVAWYMILQSTFQTGTLRGKSEDIEKEGEQVEIAILDAAMG